MSTAPEGHERAILCFGDSLSLPRPEDGVHAIHVFGPRLARVLDAAGDATVIFYDRSYPFASIRETNKKIARERAYFEGSAARITSILQIGIADCAPRPVPFTVRRLVEASPAAVRFRVRNFLHEHRAAMLNRGMSYRITEPDRFEALFRQALSELVAYSDEVIVIGIFPTSPATDAHSPGLQASIAAYNAIEDKVVDELDDPRVRFVPVTDLTEHHPERLTDDGIHILAGTHELLMPRLLDALATLDATHPHTQEAPAP